MYVPQRCNKIHPPNQSPIRHASFIHVKGHPMRFFNAGVEVAHDGSPAPSAVAAPSPLRPAPPLAPSFAGQLDGGNNDIGATTASGVNPSGDAGGLPMFSMAPLARGRNRPPAAPPEELGAENAPPSVCIERHAQRSSDGRHQPERSSPAVSATLSYGRGQPGYPQTPFPWSWDSPRTIRLTFYCLP